MSDVGFDSIVRDYQNEVALNRARAERDIPELWRLRRAGFRQDQITEWAIGERQRLSSAGFDNAAIDKYLTGLDVPTQPPQALLERFQKGNEFQRILEAGAKGVSEGFGDEPLGIDPETEAELRRLGIWSDPTTGSGGPLRFANEAFMRPAATLLEGFLRGIRAGIYGVGGLAGQTLEEAGAVEEGKGEKVGKEIGEFAEIGGMLLGAMPFYGVKGKGDVPIAQGLPKADDFVSGAEALGGSEAQSQKLLTMYKKHGLHPAEVVDDATQDITIVQDMLSADDRLPESLVPNVRVEDMALQPGGRDIPFTVQAQGKINGVDWTATFKSEQKPNGKFSLEREIIDDEGIRIYHLNDKDEWIEGPSPDGYFDAKDIGRNIREDIEAADGRITSNAVVGGGGGKPPTEPPPTGAGAEGEVPRIGGPTMTVEDAVNDILSQISIGEQPPKRGVTWDELVTNVSDHLYPILKKAPEAYPIYRLLSGVQGKIEQFLHHSAFSFKDYRGVGESLADIIADARGDLDEFRAFITAIHGLELEANGIKSGFKYNSLLETAFQLKDKWQPLWTRLARFNNNLLQYLLDSGVVSKSAYDYMVKNYIGYTPFHGLVDESFFNPFGRDLPAGYQVTNPLKRLKGVGEMQMIDPLESIIKNVHLFVTMAERNEAAKRLVDVLQKVAEGTGSEKLPAIIPKRNTELSAAVLENAQKLGASADMPDDLLGLMEDIAGGQFSRKMHGEDKPGEINVYIDGKKITYEVDRDIANAVRGLDLNTIQWYERILAPFARTMRAGYVFTPSFWARFLMREPWYDAATYKGEGVYTPVDLVRGMLGYLFRDPEKFDAFMRSGGGHNSVVALDRNYLQEGLQSLIKANEETGLLDRGWNMLSKVAHPIRSTKEALSYGVTNLRFITEMVLSAPHYGAFLKRLRELEAKGLPLSALTKQQLQDTAWIARQTGIDNSVIGAKMVGWNSMSAFGNATIRDPIRLVEAFKDPKTRLKFILTAAALTAGSVALWWATKDDQRVKDAQPYDKNQNWLFPTGDFIFKMPKPFTFGLAFGSLPERILDAYYQEDPNAFIGFGGDLFDSFVPQLLPVGIEAVIQQWTNKNAFGSPIIPEDSKNLLPAYQYDQYTTETAKALGRIIGFFPGVAGLQLGDFPVVGPVLKGIGSPAVLEHYIQSWTGNVGMTALYIADFALRKAGVVPDSVRPDWTVSDIPFVSAFVKQYPQAGGRPITEFYDNYQKMKPFFDTWRKEMQSGDPVGAARVQQLGGVSAMMRLDNYAIVLGRQAKLIRDIYANPQFSSSTKRQLIDGTYSQMILIARLANTQIKTAIEAYERTK